MTKLGLNRHYKFPQCCLIRTAVLLNTHTHTHPQNTNHPTQSYNKHEHQRQEICNLSKPQNIFLIYFPDITNGAQSIGGGGSYENSNNNNNNNNHNDLDVGPYKIPTSKTYNKPLMSSNSDSSNLGTNSLTTEDPFNPDVRQFSKNEPYFDASTPKNVTALVGKSAYMNCRVRNLGNKTVSIIY